MGEYEKKFTQLSRYAPEMVNTEEKRRKRFLQGLSIEIQDALVTARVETYVEMVEMAQRVENSKVKVREFHNARKAGPRPWANRRAGPSQGVVRPPQQKSVGGMPQKRPGGTGTAPPAKGNTMGILCNYCGKGSHSENECWKKN